MTRGQVYAGKAVILIDALDRTDRVLATVEKKFKALGNSLGALGRTTFGAGFFGSLGSTALLARFAKYDDLILELRTKMGLLNNVTAEQEAGFSRLEKRIRELGKSTSFTTQQVAEGAIRLAQAGFSGKEIEDTLQPVLDLARGTGVELANAATVLANAIRTYNLNTEQANEITSQFVRATRSGTIEIDDLAESLKYASATAVTLGQSLPEVLAIFTLLSDKGMRGSISGTSLNTALGQIAKKKDDIKAAFGFDVPVDTNGNLMFVQFLKNMTQSTAAMDALKRTGSFQDLFNLRGARSVLPIANEQDIQRLIKLTEEISNASDEARQAAIIMDSGFGGAFRRAVSAVDDLVISLGKLQSGPLVSLLNTVPKITAAIDQLMTKYQGLTLLLASSPAIALAAGAGMIALSMVLKRVGTGISLLRMAGKAGVGLVGMSGGARALKAIGKMKTPDLLSKLGQYPVGAASTIPGAKVSQQIGSLINKGLDRQIAFRQMTAATSAAHAKTAYSQYARNKRFATAGGPFAAQHAQRAALAKQQFLTAQGNKKSALQAITALQAKKLPIGKPLAAHPIAGLLKGLGNIGKVGKSLLTFTAAASRFIFSMNGVLTVLTVLFTFGDRIPFIRGVLERLGEAFSTAFGQIGSIASSLGPSFSLISKGFAMLGDSETSGLGYKQLVIGIQSVVDIISGKLRAAWHGFFMQLGSTWDRTKQVVGTMWELFNVVSSIATTAIGNVIESSLNSVRGVLDEISMMFTGEGIGFGSIFETLTKGVASAITEITFWSARFLLEMNNVVRGLEENLERIALTTLQYMEELVRLLPGGNLLNRSGASNALASLNDRSTGRQDSYNQAQLAMEEQRNKFYKRMEELFQSDTFKNSGEAMKKALEDVQNSMGLANRASLLTPQQYPSLPGISGGGMEQIQQMAVELAAIRTQTSGYVAALVGSAQNTRGNLGRSVTEEEIKKQTDILKEIRDEIALQNEREGNVFRP